MTQRGLFAFVSISSRSTMTMKELSLAIALDRAVVVTVKLNPNLDPSVILLLFSAGVDLRAQG